MNNDIQNLHKVFVYGTLKFGQGNHNFFLKNSALYTSAISVDNTYQMYCNGGFPMTIDTPNIGFKIKGEIYCVDDVTLSALDRLEGNGSLYTREKKLFVSEHYELYKDIPDMEVPETIEAWIYLYNGNPKKYSERNCNLTTFHLKGDKIIEWNGKKYEDYFLDNYQDSWDNYNRS